MAAWSVTRHSIFFVQRLADACHVVLVLGVIGRRASKTQSIAERRRRPEEARCPLGLAPPVGHPRPAVETVQGDRPVTDGASHGEAFLVERACQVIVTFLFGHLSQVAERKADTRLLTQLPEDCQALLSERTRRREIRLRISKPCQACRGRRAGAKKAESADR
jgi:hypothetical protein